MRRTSMIIALASCTMSMLAQAREPSSPPMTREQEQGQTIFKDRCVVCHGVNADGRSDLARLMKPPPANLRQSALSSGQRSAIVRKGGEAVGRSANMPTWEVELNEEQLHAVLAYLELLTQTAQPASHTSP